MTLSRSSDSLTRTFDPAEYPHGCRCACCGEKFVEGDAIHDRLVAPNVTTPTHLRCVGLPLTPTHPFAQEPEAT